MYTAYSVLKESDSNRGKIFLENTKQYRYHAGVLAECYGIDVGKQHKFNPSILKAYDVRGVYKEEFDDGDAYYLGLAYGTFLLDHGKKTCTVGMDGRTSSPTLKLHFTDGLSYAGVDVVDIGVAMTPCVYWAMWHLDTDAAAVITASHNPAQYNGFKMITKDFPVWGDNIQKIGKIAEEGKFADGNGSIKTASVKQDYIQHVLSFSTLTPRSKELKIVFDTGNGVVADFIHDFAKHIPGKHIFLYDTVLGNFPNHVADPSLPDAMRDLRDAVLKNGYDLGVAFDGDGDRVGFIDNAGHIYCGDETLDILMRPFLKKNPGEKILFEVTSSQALIKDIKKFGGVPVMWKPGHSAFRTKMKEENIKLAAETSCHIYYGDNRNYDDSFVATLKMLDILANGNETMVDIRNTFPKTYITKKIKVFVPNDTKFAVVDKVVQTLKQEGKQFVNVDGVRVYLNEDDWFLIRASNTEPALTLRAEAMTEEGLKACKEKMAWYLGLHGVCDIHFNEW